MTDFTPITGKGDKRLHASKIECPRCHAPAGFRCIKEKCTFLFRPLIFHRERFIASSHLGTTYLPSTKIKVNKNQPKIDRGHTHEDGWISGNCKNGHCNWCTSLKCKHDCHR